MVTGELEVPMNTEEIKMTIQKSLPDAEIHVRDPHGDGQHFEAFVASAAFEGMPIIKQHRLVLGSLKVAFKESVHALALKTFTPEKWQTEKSAYGI